MPDFVVTIARLGPLPSNWHAKQLTVQCYNSSVAAPCHVPYGKASLGLVCFRPITAIWSVQRVSLIPKKHALTWAHQSHDRHTLRFSFTSKKECNLSWYSCKWSETERKLNREFYWKLSFPTWALPCSPISIPLPLTANLKEFQWVLYFYWYNSTTFGQRSTHSRIIQSQVVVMQSMLRGFVFSKTRGKGKALLSKALKKSHEYVFT